MPGPLIIVRLLLLTAALWLLGGAEVSASRPGLPPATPADTLVTDSVATPAMAEDAAPLDTLAAGAAADSLAAAMNAVAADSTAKALKRDYATWTPDPQRALWLALVIPGGGQIYNRKYWKLPIIYGGFLGCIYAMTWNNMMYRDYSQAYLDIMDNDPTTQSYNKFLHLGKTIDKSNEERYKQIFKKRKDKYRRWRDMSFFCMVGVYALSVIDAYVDAELSEFDISKDLSMKIAPTVMPTTASTGALSGSLGVHCQLNF